MATINPHNPSRSKEHKFQFTINVKPSLSGVGFSVVSFNRAATLSEVNSSAQSFRFDLKAALVWIITDGCYISEEFALSLASMRVYQPSRWLTIDLSEL